MRLDNAKFAELKKLIHRYVKFSLPMDDFQITWPATREALNEPDFVFTIRYGGRTTDVTLATSDVVEGRDWWSQLDANLQHLKQRTA